jgi:hypothetical protein
MFDKSDEKLKWTILMYYLMFQKHTETYCKQNNNSLFSFGFQFQIAAVPAPRKTTTQKFGGAEVCPR